MYESNASDAPALAIADLYHFTCKGVKWTYKMHYGWGGGGRRYHREGERVRGCVSRYDRRGRRGVRGEWEYDGMRERV